MEHPLKKIFPSLIFDHEVGLESRANYRWFRTDEQEVIGLFDEELTEETRALLNFFLTPHDIQFPIATPEEKEWEKAIGQRRNELEVAGSYRFVAFSFNGSQMSPIQFKTAICAVFDQEVPILWESECEGIIVEKKQQEATTYEEMIDVLMSDLYVNIKFLVGTYMDCLQTVHHQYEVICEAARLMDQHSERKVMTFIDALPYFFTPKKIERTYLKKLVLQEYADDEETLEMIRTFLHYNLNISETAKALHLHRNSLQYRFDRLFERTGIDLRKFRHSMAVYLVL